MALVPAWYLSIVSTNHFITFSCPLAQYTTGISSSATAPRSIRFLRPLHEILNKEMTEIYEKGRSNIEVCDRQSGILYDSNADIALCNIFAYLSCVFLGSFLHFNEPCKISVPINACKHDIF